MCKHFFLLNVNFHILLLSDQLILRAKLATMALGVEAGT